MPWSWLSLPWFWIGVVYFGVWILFSRWFILAIYSRNLREEFDGEAQAGLLFVGGLLGALWPAMAIILPAWIEIVKRERVVRAAVAAGNRDLASRIRSGQLKDAAHGK